MLAPRPCPSWRWRVLHWLCPGVLAAEYARGLIDGATLTAERYRRQEVDQSESAVRASEAYQRSWHGHLGD